MNPNTDDYSVLSFEDAAFNDRFLHIKFQPTTSEFLDFCKKKYGEHDLLDFIKASPQFLDSGTKDFSLDFVKPSPRSVEKLLRLENSGVPSSVLNELSMGLVGTEFLISYNSYKNSKDKLPEIKDILSKYSRKMIEKYLDGETLRTDVIATLAENLAEYIDVNISKLTKKNFTNLKKFLMDIPIENTVAFCNVTIKKYTNVFKNESFCDLIGNDDDLYNKIKANV